MLWFKRNPLTSGKRQRRSLFGEILDWMLAPLLILWPMSIGVTYLVAKSIANDPFDQILDDKITALSQEVTAQAEAPHFKLPNQALDILQADGVDDLRVQIIGRNGDFLMGDEKTLPIPDRERNKIGVVNFRDLVVNGEDFRGGYLWIELPIAGEKRFVLVQIAETLGKRENLANEIIKGVILPQFVILPLAVLLVWFGLSRGIAPLNSLLEIIRNRKPDDLSALETKDTPEELLPVISALNDQLARLQHTIQTQKRFVADAAHQLKTPLAGLRMQVELLSDEDDAANRLRSLRRLKVGTERSTRLVNQLLALARTEAPSVLRFEQLDLTQIARSVTRDFVPEAMNRQIDLGVEVPDHAVFVYGQTLMLTEMLKNLVENALRYTPEGGCVTVRVDDSRQRETTVLEVEDDGPGIPESERTLVFDRFYRVLGTSEDGSGLGLAIVQETAQQHGATVTILNNPKCTSPDRPGTVLRVGFPPTHIHLED
ncbi:MULTISPECIES: sensor histidine kinase N-terminal domain-containing protein [Limnobacter]|uniref:histidine kinase n=1 Tax=Limnobacter litoralis TaxID=481366 RepID=A0ABQ5YSP6_9BURK|nr:MULTISPECIES: sensor histidine kinase N-terminal domain-containing protein [Limnobacter]GLR26911.1 two-component system sensor kinase [Limnobacter litoralis]HEX5486253.1 sensor histidine kinase N-terminal domain-containing protein [Limnobacter sp.]